MIEYRVTWGDRVVHDLGLNLSVLPGSTFRLEAGSAGSLKLILDPTHPLYGADFKVKDTTNEIVLEASTLQTVDGYFGPESRESVRQLFRGRITQIEVDSGALKTLTCEGQLSYLGDTTVRPCASTLSDDMPAGTAIISGSVANYLVAQHNRRCGPGKEFSIGLDMADGVPMAATDYPTTLDCLNDSLCEGQDRYLRATTGLNGERVLDVLDGGVGTGTQTIVFGENLLDFASSKSWPDIATAIVAKGRGNRESGDTVQPKVYGDGAVTQAEPADSKHATTYTDGSTEFGLETIGDGSYRVHDVNVTVDGDRVIGDNLAARYGIFEVERSYDVSTPDGLLQAAAYDLDDRAMNVREIESLDVTAYDLSVIDPDLKPITLLEWLRVYAPALGCDQWMPCSVMTGDVTDPARTEFHIGDLPKTLTRQSALRMGLVRKSTGDLIRRADGSARDSDLLHEETNRNSERIDEAVEKAEQDLGKATDEWARHLDEETGRWYESLDEAEREAAQGREELQKSIDEMNGTWSDELGRIDGEIDGVNRVMDGIQELADSARRTFYGTCATGASTAAKLVPMSAITKPGGQEFELAEGVVIDVNFTYHNSVEGGTTLDVGGTGAYPVMAYGGTEAYWKAHSTVRFVFDGSAWQCASVPVWASEVTVGNPNEFNFYTNGTKSAMRVGATDYIRATAQGQQIGLDGRTHVFVDDDGLDVQGSGNRSIIHFGVDSEGYGTISTGVGSGVQIMAGGSPNSCRALFGSSTLCDLRWPQISLHGTTQIDFDAGYFTVAKDGTSHTLDLFALGKAVRRSVIAYGNDTDEITFSASKLGFSGSFQTYCIWVANGDWSACNFYPIGVACDGTTVRVKLDRTLPSNYGARFNFFGVDTSWALPSSNYDPENPEGPEVFGDEPGQETTIESEGDHAA